MLGACLVARAAGVTLVTHGFNSSVDGWIVPMVGRMAHYPALPGTNSSCYQISITRNAQTQYVASASFIGGVSPLVADSGEILIKLDWSTLSSFGGASSTIIANATVNALLANEPDSSVGRKSIGGNAIASGGT